MSARVPALLLKFKNDTLATVSRSSVKDMARKLGFNETQVAHYALARLREELLGSPGRPGPEGADQNAKAADNDYPALTAEQLRIIRKHAPKRRGAPLTTDSLF
ncbi:MAG: hypothetical protein JSS46_11460 [Proteobacteria bacterium]|nr:hypothetical protein [Pseudomonadota bacterium]